MDFRESKEHALFREEVREFTQKEFPPLIDEYEEKDQPPVQIFKAAADRGYLGLLHPKQYGGMGKDLTHFVIFVEETTAVCAGIAGLLGLHISGGTYPVSAFGTEEQKQKYLVPAIRGEKISAFATTEPTGGSDVAGMLSTAKRDGQDYIINGKKSYISNGSFAHFFNYTVKTDPTKGAEGISMFFVDADTPGLTRRRMRTMGHRTGDTAELFLADCRVPKINLVGEEGKGFYYLMETVKRVRMLNSSQGVGLSRAVLGMAIEYAKNRRAFGRPISSFQGLRWIMADMATRLEASRLLVYEAAWAVQENLPDCMKYLSMAKLYASETANHCAYQAGQIYGANGYNADFAIERMFRDAREFTLGDGTSEIHRVIIGRNIGL